MNKKIIKLFLINTILISILSFGNVYAENQCIDTSIGDKITVKYETKYDATSDDYDPCPGQDACDPSEYTVEPGEGYYYNLIINNLSKNMYIEINNDYYTHFSDSEMETETFDFNKFTNGALIYKSFNIYYPVNYEIKIYDNNQKCLLKTLTITTPFLNNYIETNAEICNRIPNYKNCKTWVNKKISKTDFYNGAKKYATNNNVNINNLLPEEYSNNNYLKFIAIFVLFLLIALIFIFLFKKKKSKKIKLGLIIFLLSLIFLKIDVNAATSYKISTKKFTRSNTYYYWIKSNDGTGIYVKDYETIKKDNETLDLYCVSPKKNAGKSAYLEEISQSYKCNNVNEYHSSCSAIYILSSSYSKQKKLIALRFLAADSGFLDGDGIWGHGYDNIYANTVYNIKKGSNSKTPYWKNSDGNILSDAKSLYKTARNMTQYNFSTNYVIYKATETTSSTSYQKYYTIQRRGVSCSEFANKKITGYKYDANKKNTKITDITENNIKNNCFKIEVNQKKSCTNSSLTNNQYYRKNNILYKRKSNYKDIKVDNTNDDTVLKKCFTETKSCSDYNVTKNEYYRDEQNNIHKRKSDYKKIELAKNSSTNKVISTCFDTTKNTCTDWANFWKPLNLQKTYYKNGAKCYEQDSKNTITSKSSDCLKSYTYSGLNFTFNKTGILIKYTFKNADTVIAGKDYNWEDYLKTCYDISKPKCSELDYVKKNATYKDSEGKIHKKKTNLDEIEVDQVSDYTKCYEETGEFEKKSCATSAEDLEGYVGTFTFDSSDDDSYFSLEKYNKITDEKTKKNYLEICPCNCDSSAADIKAGCTIVNKSGNWNVDTANSLNGTDYYSTYNVACPPCNFEKDPVCGDDNVTTCGSENISEASTTKITINSVDTTQEISDPSYVIKEAESVIDAVNELKKEDDKSFDATIQNIKDEIENLKELLSHDEKIKSTDTNNDDDKKDSVENIRKNIESLIKTFNSTANIQNNTIYSQASYKVNYEESQINACLSSLENNSDYNFREIYGINTVCKDEYDIQYTSGQISTGINTSIGVSTFLRVSDRTLANDNTIKVLTTRTCYFNEITEEEKNTILNSTKSNYYASAPSFSFTYEEDIANNGFKTYLSSAVKPQFVEGNKIIFQKLYEYEPSTEYHVNVLNGDLYYKDDDSAFNDKNNIIKPYDSNNKNKIVKLGKVFPIKFSTSIPAYDEKKDGDKEEFIKSNSKKYSINLENYNISEKALNYKKDDDSCGSSFACNYIITKKTCTKTPCVCSYICMKNDIPEKDKATSPYCSEVCTNETENKDPNLGFVYTTISTDNVLNENATSIIGQNWKDAKGTQAKNEIQDTSQKGKTFSDENLVYEINMNTNLINKIRNNPYKSYVGSYSCDKKIEDDNGNETDIWSCTSDFLSDLNKNPEYSKYITNNIDKVDASGNKVNSRAYTDKKTNKITAYK